MNDGLILITGTAGKTGRAIIHAAQKRELRLRALVRRPGQASLLVEAGISDVLVGDMRDPAVYQQAAQGVAAIYHICPNLSPDEIEIGALAIRAAREAGVRRFVYHSVLHPHIEAMPHHWRKLRVEEMLFESGLDFTIVQPAAYMQNLLAGWSAIIESGVYRVPYPLTTRLGMVDLEDVAEVAAKVLAEETHSGAIYELATAEVLTQSEVAAVLSDSLGRPVTAEQEPLDAWKAKAQESGLGQSQIDELLAMFNYYASFGFWGNENIVSWLLGRAPTRLADFVKRVVHKSGK